MPLLRKKRPHFLLGDHPTPDGWVHAHEQPSLTPIHAPSKLPVAPFPLPRGRFDLSPVHQHGNKESYQFPSTFVLELSRGSVLGKEGVVLTANNRLLADTAIHFGRSISGHRIFGQASLTAPTPISSRLAVLASIDAHVYFHWMCNILPRLELLRRSKSTYDQLYLPALSRPYQVETLRHLDIDLSQVVFGAPGIHLQASELIVPSLPAAPCDCPPWVCDFLRSSFLQETRTKKRRLYLSRNQAHRRRIANEKELIGLLSRHGFEGITLETLSVTEQASLFANAEAIIAPHGAGLTNLVFCSPGTKVVEIFHPSWICDCYWQISHHLNLDHQVMVAKKGYRNLINRINDRNRDSRVDLKAITRLLQELQL